MHKVINANIYKKHFKMVINNKKDKMKSKIVDRNTKNVIRCKK